MTLMTRARWILLGWGLTVALGVAGLVLMFANWRDGEGWFTPHPVISLGFASVGALIMLRRPHRIGTLFLGFGAFAAITGFVFQGCPAFDEGGTAIAAVCGHGSRVASVLWPGSYLFFGSLFLVFPTGRLPSRRWWPVALVFFGSWGTAAIGGLVMGDVWVEEQTGFVLPLAVWSLAVVALAPLFRIRKADPIEKQQLRWLAYVIGLTLLLMAIGVALDLAGQDTLFNALIILVFANVVIGVPATITMAILRYRLYDIDVIVNRTLVYVTLTAALAAFYLGIVIVLQHLLAPVTADSDLAVAGSTLAVAALFGPMRRWVQTFIDQRFYRLKYDAAEALQSFSSNLRDQVDLGALSTELLGVVRDTVQPAHASLWLRSEGATR